MIIRVSSSWRTFHDFSIYDSTLSKLPKLRPAQYLCYHTNGVRIMECQSHNRDFKVKIAKSIPGFIFGHIRAFREKKWGKAPGLFTKGYVVLGKYEKNIFDCLH